MQCLEEAFEVCLAVGHACVVHTLYYSLRHACMTLICNFAVAFLRLTRLGSIEFRPALPALVCAASLSLFLSLLLPLCLISHVLFCFSLWQINWIARFNWRGGSKSCQIIYGICLDNIYRGSTHSQRIASKALRTLQYINSDWEREWEGGRGR